MVCSQASRLPCILPAMRRDRQREAKKRTKEAHAAQSVALADARWDRQAVVAIFAAVVVAYFSVFGAGFTNWDDDRFIADNPLFQGSIGAYVWAALTRVQFCLLYTSPSPRDG